MTTQLRLFITLMTLMFAAVACSPEESGSDEPTPIENNQTPDAGPKKDTSRDPGPCGEITHEGTCFANTAMWCDFGVQLKSQSCTNNGGTGCEDGACRGIAFGHSCDLLRNLCADGLVCRKGTCTTEESGTMYLDINGRGRVTSASPIINCTGACPVTEPGGTKIALHAEPDIGWKFTGWSDGCHGNELTTDFTVIASRTLKCTASFERVFSTFTIISKGTTVVSQPAGIICEDECTAFFDVGQNVRLTATPDPGFVFIGWSGCKFSSELSITVDANDDLRCTAESRKLEDLTVEVVGNGRVLRQGSNFECTGICTMQFLPFRNYHFEAIPGRNAKFIGWEQGCSGTNRMFLFNQEFLGPNHCRAIFEDLPTNLLTVSIIGEGSVRSSDGAIDCPDVSCSAHFPTTTFASFVSLRATPTPASRFVRWVTMDDPASTHCTIHTEQVGANMAEPRHCQAQFAPVLKGEVAWQHAAVPRNPQGARWSPDGTQFVAFNDQVMKRFDTASGRFLGPGQKALQNTIESQFTWDPQGTRIASATMTESNDGTQLHRIFLRNIATSSGSTIVSPVAIQAIAWNPDSQSIASAGDDGTIKVWALSGRDPLLQDWIAHNSAVTSLSWSPNGQYLASSNDSEGTRIWETSTWTLAHEFSAPGWNSLDWNHDSTRIAGATPDQLHVWNFDGTQGASWPATDCTSVNFDPTGTKLAAVCDSKLTTWDVASRSLLLTAPAIGATAVKTAHWNPTSNKILALYDDHQIRILHSETGAVLHTFNHGSFESLTDLAFNPVNNHLYAASADGFVYAVDTATGATATGFKSQFLTDTISSIALTPSSDKIIAAHGSSIYEWSALTGASVRPAWNAGSPVTDLSLSNNNVLATSLADTDGIRLWPTRGQPHTQALTDTLPSRQIVWQPGGHLLASMSQNKAHLWNTQTGLIERTLECRSNYTALHISFSSDGTHFALGCTYEILTWDLANNTEPTPFQLSFSTHLAWQPGTKTFATTTSSGQQIHLYDATTGSYVSRQFLRIPGISSSLMQDKTTQLVWSADGKQLFAGSETGIITAFDVTP